MWTRKYTNVFSKDALQPVIINNTFYLNDNIEWNVWGTTAIFELLVKRYMFDLPLILLQSYPNLPSPDWLHSPIYRACFLSPEYKPYMCKSMLIAWFTFSPLYCVFSLKLHGKSGYYCNYNTAIIKSDGKTASSQKLLDHYEFHNLTKEPTKNFATY